MLFLIRVDPKKPAELIFSCCPIFTVTNNNMLNFIGHNSWTRIDKTDLKTVLERPSQVQQNGYLTILIFENWSKI